MEATDAISIYAGNSEIIKDTVKDQDGNAFPLAGYICTFMIKANKLDETSLVSIVAAPEDISANVVTFRLSREDTAIRGNYWYEVTVADDESAPLLLKTVSQGRLYSHDSLVPIPTV